jgi:flagellar export protein FliJ
MNRRERIVDTVYRIAEVRERQAAVGLGRAQAAREEAETSIEALEADNAAAEADLVGPGVMGDVERQLLWAHRAWARRERVSTEERLAITEAEVEAAQARLIASKGQTRVREAVKDRVHGEARSVRDAVAQRELDEIARLRSRPRE